MRGTCVCLLLVYVAGCGGEYKFAPVSGRVTVEGKPAANLHVTFEPIGSNEKPYPGPGSVGVTDATGAFTLKSIPKEREGAVIGKHRVRITALPPKGNSPAKDAHGGEAPQPTASFRQLPLHYLLEPKLTFEVLAEGSKRADFDLAWK